jgi:predicted nucleic acid-binding protein
MIVVSDTSPVLSLTLIGQLDLLRQLYGSIVLPEAVRDELIVGGAAYHNGGEVLQQEWIRLRAVANPIVLKLLQRELDRGEAEALALAIDLKADLILLDEFKARRLADYLELPHAGVIDLLGEAKRLNYLKTIKPTLDALIDRAHFHVSPKLYQRTLQSAGELDDAHPA